MGKTIIVMRHGEYDDTTKLLTEDGKADARDVTGQLATDNHVPNVIVHSEAPRAKETAEIMAETFRNAGYEVTVEQSENLNYDHNFFFGSVEELPETTNTVLLVTHNLALDGALLWMNYQNEKRGTPSYPACAYVCQEKTGSDVSWGDIYVARGRCMEFRKYYKPSRLEL
jgi:phosphohistidine phosphatase SixA